MKTFLFPRAGGRFAAAFLFAILAMHRPAAAQESSRSQGFDAFRLLLTRNVFDPDRRAFLRSTGPQRTLPPGTVRSSVTLTGTMVTSGKSLAFFGSSRSEYNKVVSAQESIGDYKVLSIEPHAVTLEHAGQTTVLGVGKQLPLAGTEPAPAGTSAEMHSETSAEPGSAAPVAPLPAGVPADKDETLRRMMQRRQQEMSR